MKLPIVKNTENNKENLDSLEQEIEVFSNMIEASSASTNTWCRNLTYFFCFCNCICVRNRCKKFLTAEIYESSNEILFGELTQCKLIMEKNFEGKQFMIDQDPERGLPAVDCMFFPATHGDFITLDPDQSQSLN